MTRWRGGAEYINSFNMCVYINIYSYNIYMHVYTHILYIDAAAYSNNYALERDY